MKEKSSKNNKSSPSKTSRAKLRQKAERLYTKKTPINSNLTSAEKDTLLHELEVHQIELEIQNEELRRAQEELEEARNSYSDLFDFAPVGYFVLDQYYIIKQSNLTGSRMLGLERGNLTGKRFSQFISQEFADQFYLYLRSRKDAPERSCEIEMHNHAGTPFYVQLKSVVISSGKDTHHRVTITDITQLKRSEETIKRLARSLSGRATNLEMANKELKDMEISISQDLKATLRQMEGFSQALIEDYAAKLDERGADYLRRIQSCSRKMTEYLNDLMMLSSVTVVELQTEEISLSTLVENVATKLRTAHAEHQVELVIEPRLAATGDLQLLRLAILNLIDNALKFTVNCSPSRIEFGALENGSEPTYFIRDNGVGFDMRYADKLFIPFQRLHSQREFTGHGIGLAIVQRIIHRHGGEIWAEAKKGEGATFYFTLPRPRDTAIA